MKAGLRPTHLRCVKNRRSGRVLASLGSIFIGRKPDFRSVTLDLQQTPTARRGRRAGRQTAKFFLSILSCKECMLCFIFCLYTSVSLCPYLPPAPLILPIKRRDKVHFVHTAKTLSSHLVCCLVVCSAMR